MNSLSIPAGTKNFAFSKASWVAL